jgi:iron(III) transport system permease protein
MYYATQQTPAQYDVAAALGSPLLIFGVTILVLNKILLGDLGRFVTHGGKSFRTSTKSSKLGAVGLVLYGVAATLLPIIGLVLVALSPYWSGQLHPSQFTLQAFHQLFHDGQIVTAIKTSLVVSVIAVAITLPLGYLGATILRRRAEFPVLRPLLDMIVAMPLSIPAVIFGVGFLFAYTRGPLVLYGTNWVLVLVYITLMIPFSARMQLSGMVALGDSYQEASRVSGGGVLRTHLTIMAPLMRATFAGVAALMFILLANEFAASLLVRSPTQNVMGTVLYNYYGNGLYPVVAATALVMVAVTGAGVAIAMIAGGSDIFKKL